jgi:hypothetical protein
MGMKTKMAEPTTTTTGGAVVLFKYIALLLPVGATLIAFWLGVRFVPLRTGREWEDVINRVIACFISAFVFGTFALVLLLNHFPKLFDGARSLAMHAQFPPEAGFFLFTGCVMVVCSIPGPWIVAAVFLWLERRRGKDIAEIVNDVRNIKLAITNERGPRHE